MLPHEAWTMGQRPGWNESKCGTGTLGYAVAPQAPNGVIHLASSMNHPSQHFEMNEAWILSGDAGVKPGHVAAGQRQAGEMRYPDGRLRAQWSGVVWAARGFVLDGLEGRYFADGRLAGKFEFVGGELVRGR